MSDPSGRGPLAHIILAQTGEDVRNCVNCELCDQSFPEADYTFNELMQATARNDLHVLERSTLWNCDNLLESKMTCLGGIDIPKVIQALRDEASLRGYKPKGKSNQGY
jgi:heterodisulfide reductase subunit C